MKILVTGATGFIGKHLIKELQKNQISIHLLLRKNSNKELFKDFNTFTYDVDSKKLINYFKKENFDGVIHLASLFLTEHKENDISRLIHSNIELGTHLLEACKESNTKWFINTGTFWQNFNNEDYNPVNLYAATKEAFINLSKYYTETSNLIFTTIKLNDTFGPDDTRNKVFNLWNSISKTDEKLGMSPGDQIIDISYIEDIVNAYVTLIKHLNSTEALKFNQKCYAIKAEKRLTLKELASLFEEVSNKKLNITWGERQYREREVMNPWDKGLTLPEWKPKYNLNEAIAKTLENIND